MLKDKKSYLWFLVSLAALLILFLAGMFRYLYFGRTVLPRFSRLPVPNLSIKNDGHHLGVNDLGVIQSWMTFDYINNVFALPPDYLKTSLKITSSRYPFLTIKHYARTQQMDVSSTMDLLRQNIANYLKP
jgi:hypothetical protein